MFITGLGTATPPRRYTRAECWDSFQAAPQFAHLDRRVRTTLQRVLLHDNGIGCDLHDERFDGDHIDVAFVGTLRLDQEAALAVKIWALVDGKPVSLAVFNSDAAGHALVEVEGIARSVRGVRYS